MGVKISTDPSLQPLPANISAFEKLRLNGIKCYQSNRDKALTTLSVLCQAAICIPELEEAANDVWLNSHTEIL